MSLLMEGCHKECLKGFRYNLPQHVHVAVWAQLIAGSRRSADGHADGWDVWAQPDEPLIESPAPQLKLHIWSEGWLTEAFISREFLHLIKCFNNQVCIWKWNWRKKPPSGNRMGGSVWGTFHTWYPCSTKSQEKITQGDWGSLVRNHLQNCKWFLSQKTINTLLKPVFQTFLSLTRSWAFLRSNSGK